MIDPQEIEFCDVYHLPIIKAYADRIDLVNTINRLVPTKMEIDPGTLVLAMILFGIIVAKKNKVPRERFVLKEAAVSVRESFWEILLPVHRGQRVQLSPSFRITTSAFPFICSMTPSER